jgi:hypothetical protein
MSESLLAALAAIGGFLAKSIWDLYWARKLDFESAARQKQLEFLERQLKEFYWPLHIHLQKNDAVWEFARRTYNSSNLVERSVNAELMRSFFLPNHQVMVTIIENNVHLAKADTEVERLIQAFLRHVAVLSALKSTGLEDLHPIAVGEPWPKGLSEAIARRTLDLQDRFDQQIGLAGSENRPTLGLNRTAPLRGTAS